MRFLASLFLCLFGVLAFAQAPQYDVLIRNGKLVDGTGNPWIYADIGINGDRITFIGHAAANVTAKRTIDAKDLIVAPGFIDMLGQSETNLLVDKQAVSKLTQGITTEITGEGGSISPLNDKLKAEDKDFTDHFHIKLDWQSLDEYFHRLEKQGSGINLGTYVGAAQLRDYVIGNDDRPPTADELKTMSLMVGDAMDDGAMGVSSALIYAPGSYAKTDELVALAKAAAEKGGIYASHIRNEGDKEMDALNEAFQIAREANIPVEIFHLKCSGKQNAGKMKDVIAAIEHARADGLDITADQYPYIASATSLGATIPAKWHAGGTDAFIAKLKDSATRAQIRAELSENNTDKFENMWRGVGGPEGVMVVSVLNPELKKYEGRTVADIAKMENKDPFDALVDFVIADHDNTGAVYFSMDESDVRLAMQQPWVSVGTDYGEVNPEGPLGESKSHPRAYGSFPRILGKYVREEHVLRLEDAIRKMTSLAAQKVRLDNRGLIKQDYYADITIFDPNTVIDVATFENPNRPSKGIEYVLVNGVVSLEHEKVTGNLGGRPLRGPGYYNRAVSPDGLRPKGKISGFTTSPDGWPVTRAEIKLIDKSGNVVMTVPTRLGGKYEITTDKPCVGCKLTASRQGFMPAEKKIDYNGSNSLFFSFELKPEKRSGHGH